MMGLAPKIPPAAAKAPPAAAPVIPALDFDAALPAVRAPRQGTATFENKPTAPAMPQVARPASPPPFGGLDDLDLPALAGELDLPAPVKRPPPKKAAPAPTPKAAVAPPPPQGPFTFDVDLPSVSAPPPQPHGFGSIDLPAAKRPPAPGPAVGAPGMFGAPSGFGDLPMAKPGGGGFADLPMTHKGATALPATKHAMPGGFGEIDLPSLQNDLPQNVGAAAHLPSPVGANAHLPSPVGANAHLPSPVGANAHLPSPLGANAHLPSPMGANAHLPAAVGAGAYLPSPMGAGAHLPTAMAAGAHLPTAMAAGAHLPTASGPGAHLPSPMAAGAHLPSMTGPNAHLPQPMGMRAHMPQVVSDDRLLPNKHGAPSPITFGELDLPLVGSSDFGPPRSTGGGGFGEVDLPADNAPMPSMQPSAGGMAFGEVDLGGGNDGGAPLGPSAATSGSSFAFHEASLDSGRGKAPVNALPGRLRKPAPDGPPSKLPKILGIGLAVVVLGGAALQLTSVGAFGHLWISDKIHAGENVTVATSKGDFARKKMAVDTFAAAQGAADELVDARKRAPRSRPLGAYAAFVEYMNQVRFGLDPARAARVNNFLVDIPSDVTVPYLAAARAAQTAQSGDWAKAKADVDAAIAREPKDGIQHELAILRGEIALALRDPATALSAFNAAHATGASARTSFGIARAQTMARVFPKALAAVDATLKASPTHAGAMTLRAQLAWDPERNDVAAAKDLALVLDEKNRKALGTSELGFALTTKGWIMFARDRAGEARTAFDEAVKLDPRNVSALVGQGEVLYADGRFTEAFTRFEEAVHKQPTSLPAMIGSAKTQIALERLSDAKAQLAAARAIAPKDMNVALWLARVEDALGNRKVADELYGKAIDLADPQTPDAIEAYATYARFLASQGKNAEAAAKLEQARAKLPDTPALQRAFGEVAVSQGQFAQALEHFEAALKKTPSDLGTRFRLGQTYRKMHKLDLAAQALDEVGAIDKEYPGLALERGLRVEESGDVQKALEQFQSASQKAPNDVDLLLRVGAAYVAIGDTEKALPMLVQVRDKRPNSAEANHFLGRAYLKQGGLEANAAKRYLERAVTLDPNKAEYHLYVAWAANEAVPAQLGLARAEIEKALQLDHLLADAYWQRGIVERKESQTNDAIKDLRRALELKPARHEAHATLGEAFEDKNDIASATVEWQRAIAGDEKPPYWRWKYGKILADKNANAEAAKHLVYAVEQGKALQPRPGWLTLAAFEAGETLRKTGQKKEACEHYHLFMELSSSSSPDRRDALKAQTELGCPWENH